MRNMFKRQQGPAIPNALRRFHDEEDGMSAPIILMFFVTMVMIGGIALDVARFEHERVAVQNTLDRAALAAANLDQDLRPQDVVQDFFDKAGYGHALGEVNAFIAPGNTSRVVRVEAEARTNNYFMQWLNIDTLESVNSSQAEQQLTDIEIMLVLDVSGSMGSMSSDRSGTKIENLRIAAKEFVDTVMGENLRGRVSIGIVPYAAQVNIGQPLASQYNIAHRINTTLVPAAADYACIEIPPALYSSVALSRITALPMMSLASVTNTTGSPDDRSYSGGYTNPPSAAPSWCRADTGSIIMLPTKIAAVANARIDRLASGGNTSILLGMRWGTALLDPSARPIYSALIASNDMEPGMLGQPFDYTVPGDGGSRNVSKIVILMTDGEHVAHNRIVDDFKTGLSPIFFNAADPNVNNRRYSVFHPRRPGANKYWVPHTGTWQGGPFGGGTALQLDYSEVWARLPAQYVAQQFFARAGQYTSNAITSYAAQRNAFYSSYGSVTQMNDRLRDNCAAARTAGLLIYGIAFEAPATGQAAIRNCVSAPEASFYFNAQGTSIRAVFRRIAANITQLRLTQ